MAESAVSFVIDKLTSFLSQEVELLEGVHEKVAEIKNDLETIRAFLKDADSKVEKEDSSEVVKLWVKKAREVAYQLEDVIDRYMLLVARRHDQQGFVGFLKKISTFVKQLRPCHEIGSELQQIREAIIEVKNNANSFQFIPSVQGAERSNARNIILHDPRLSSLAIEEVELVGIESPRNELINLLVKGTSRRKVISVVGLGGVGKTTIARKVYDNHIVKSHFKCRAWITVSQSYDTEKLLRSILQGFYEEKKEDVPRRILTMEAPLLIGELKDYLRGKQFLVVFDDVWDTGFWGVVEHALLDNNDGSRIMFTTRNEDVTISCKRSSLVDVYPMKLLTDQEAWELFCKKAFKLEFGGECPNDLKKLSSKIVRRCGGLPLAIVVIGGVLAIREKKVPEWEKLLHSLESAMVGDQDFELVSKILSLSYNDLPYNLKSCFLYLGMFPEDFSIKRRRLISLWVASGFVQEKQGMTLVEVGEEYLIELIHRSLLQVDRPNRVKGIPSSVRVHDLIRDIILSKSEELNLCHVSSSCSSFSGIARHLLLSNRGSDYPMSITKFQTRSVMVFDNTELQKPVVEAIFTTCKLLTSLDFESCPVDHLELGKLLHLRYLNLRNTKVSELPKSIGKLHNLQYLDLRHSSVCDVLFEIDSCPKLKHIFGDELRIHSSIGHLELLQTLSTVTVYNNKGLIKQLGMLKQLRKLGIKELKREDGRDLCISLEKMTNLRSLYLQCFIDRILEVQSMSSPPLRLQTLKLWGNLERLPGWISKLHNLSKLRLWFSGLMDDPIKILQLLPNLMFLELWAGYGGRKIHFEQGGFQRLKWLNIADLTELNTIIIDKGAMPILEELSICGCQQLMEVPSGIQHLTGLNRLEFTGMPDAFKQRLRSGGVDYWIVKHVPSLYCNWSLLSPPNDETAFG